MLVDVGKETLTSLGYLVTATTSSNKALALFRENPALFDMLISDVTMPEMTGEKLVSQIKAIRGDLPVILLTGYSDRLQGETSESLGVEGLMYKPLKRAGLAEAIYSIFKTRARKNV
jgi:CheY-like chemotaxis protein